MLRELWKEVPPELAEEIRHASENPLLPYMHGWMKNGELIIDFIPKRNFRDDLCRLPFWTVEEAMCLLLDANPAEQKRFKFWSNPEPVAFDRACHQVYQAIKRTQEE